MVSIKQQMASNFYLLNTNVTNWKKHFWNTVSELMIDDELGLNKEL